MTRLAALAHRRARAVLAVAVLLAVAAGAFGAGVAERLGPYGAEDPATESARTDALIQRTTGAEASPGFVAVVPLPGSPRRADSRARLQRVERLIARSPEVARTASYLDTRDRAMLSRDRRLTYVTATFRPLDDKRLQEAAETIAHRLEAVPGVRSGGSTLASAQVNETVEEDLKRAEMLVFPLLLVLAFVIFRSLVAALLPLLVGGLAIVATIATLRVANEVTEVSIFALNLTTGLGLGLAIDYSLFIVSRYREELARVGPGAEALRRTMATAGRTVLFSSLTVAGAMASLLVFPQRFLYSMGIGGSAVALIAAAVALIVLPAVLALLGTRVNALAPKRLQRAAERDSRPDEAGGWYRLSRSVTRRPGPIALLATVVLVLASLPFLRAEWVWVDAYVLPTDASARTAQQVLDREFPPHRDAPLTVAVRASGGPALDRLVREARALPGVAEVRPPRRVAGELTLVDIVPEHAPLTAQSRELVERVRAIEPGATAQVTGFSAQYADFRQSLGDHLPLAMAIVAVATLLVLFLFTGSVLLPLKAFVMNLLTVGATLGMLVLVFQDGRLESVLGYTSQGGLEMTMPVLLFAVVFGLSTDYGVFLLSRIKEARDAGAGERESIAIGLERTGRVVTAAALLFALAIGAFATSRIIFIKENGVGTAFAVLLDATLIRALLVPSLMALMGRWNWWAPRPLRALHDRIGLREHRRREAPA